MSEHLKLPKTECLKRLERVIEAGKNLRSSIKTEYGVYVDAGNWQNLPDGLLQDWAERFHQWQEDAKEQLKEIFVAGMAKTTKFENHTSAMRSVGPKLNDNFRIITDKMKNKIDVLLEVLESLETTGQHNSVNVTNSHGVVINTGTIEGNIEINANKIKNEGNPQLAEAINELMKAIKQDNSGELESEAMLQQAGILAQQATLPAGQRKTTVIKAAWSYIEAFSRVATIGNFLMSHGKTIAAFFGL